VAEKESTGWAPQYLISFIMGGLLIVGTTLSSILTARSTKLLDDLQTTQKQHMQQLYELRELVFQQNYELAYKLQELGFRTVQNRTTTTRVELDQLQQAEDLEALKKVALPPPKPKR
jgi:hypothetical protein